VHCWKKTAKFAGISAGFAEKQLFGRKNS